MRCQGLVARSGTPFFMAPAHAPAYETDFAEPSL
ncbi:protein of unknown function [Cupriavidus taiwanensis]|uniref:Uncharacterized protein n=1 Tax=Cupriavidus taiwanensis TaxID=164546 RepID=A0A375IES5_9BURK|nr:hypothetical protein CBM2588_A120135 [Cupriavidus taiwanensis]SOY45673.1 hypothetical protein CBM2592_A160056 [Cupriavidus taiwanensis]SOY81118.1 hypothetical protein CBM2591_A190056 [Cupriavidus taiwanensis]SOZ53495.1 hypothetical protein CBM2617_A160134 [Cupriavidus taiwanensis]SOZ77641.1 hypothetical protein CBM2622_A150134 [Cupriavidus taiwanensis]